MEKIVFLDRQAIRVPLRSPNFPHEWIEYAYTPRGQAVERLQGATIAINNRVPIDEALLDAVPTLRLVAVSATGYDHVEIAACQKRGVAVCNVRDWAVSIPEHVFALILALRRQLLGYRQIVEDGTWGASPTYGFLLEPMPHALAGATLGLIGYGALARRVEAIARAFDMNILVAERKGEMRVRAGRAPFKEVLRESDVLSVLCPLTDETRWMIGPRELACMRSSALLINCARGGIVDEAALADALRRGRLGGAAADVLAQEPPSEGSPLIGLDLPNLIVTPHMAWASVESLETLAEQLIGNIEAFAAGAPRNLVTMPALAIARG
ncbi:lactate dehydrogenase [Capsulimonas corticalis]|uniref:Lactate dehydrogenase n=1 Tax=Capsulimonas corticalis TaxID=2219043 RepID=A0A402CNW1_9BACT|nr:D-2-hydroxyacid dehydrogenase [Capsulimonas corticalis]BDI33288.1 lactate dehydrogenase [Capsulimonas corticalis]